MRPGRHHGFTLLELLIVIGVMATLMSMLLPALQSAKNSVKKIVCVNNLKTLGQNVMMYAADNDGYLPAVVNECGVFWTYGGNPTQNKSPGALADYYNTPPFHFAGGENGLLTCPMDQRKDDQYSYNKPNSYALNANICGYPGLAYTDGGPHRLTRYLTAKVMAMEFTSDDDDMASLGKPRFYDYEYNYQQAWHGKGSNFLWLDGHVDWNKYRSLPAAFFAK